MSTRTNLCFSSYVLMVASISTSASGQDASMIQSVEELRPRMIVKLTRCFPTTISLSGSEEAMRLEKHTELSVTDRGLVVAEQ